jgi:hypothetical protein
MSLGNRSSEAGWGMGRKQLDHWKFLATKILPLRITTADYQAADLQSMPPSEAN